MTKDNSNSSSKRDRLERVTNLETKTLLKELLDKAEPNNISRDWEPA